MSWTLEEAARVLLTGRRHARSMGQEFKFDPDRMRMAGFTPSEVAAIEAAVDKIESYTADELSKLKRVL